MLVLFTIYVFVFAPAITILNAVLRNARGTAEVFVDLRQDGICASLRLPGVRVKPDWNLVEDIQSLLGGLPGRTCQCSLLGAPKAARKKPAPRAADDETQGQDPAQPVLAGAELDLF